MVCFSHNCFYARLVSPLARCTRSTAVRRTQTATFDGSLGEARVSGTFSPARAGCGVPRSRRVQVNMVGKQEYLPDEDGDGRWRGADRHGPRSDEVRRRPGHRHAHSPGGCWGDARHPSHASARRPGDMSLTSRHTTVAVAIVLALLPKETPNWSQHPWMPTNCVIHFSLGVAGGVEQVVATSDRWLSFSAGRKCRMPVGMA